MKTTKQVLLDAAELVRKGWCQYSYALDHEGREVDPENPAVCSMCLDGALMRAGGSKDLNCTPEYMSASAVVCKLLPCYITWNDTEGRTQQEVIDLLLKAAEVAE